MRALAICSAVLLAGCEAWALKDYDQRSTSIIFITKDCRVELHEGEVAGGPAAGTPATYSGAVDIRPDIEDGE